MLGQQKQNATVQRADLSKFKEPVKVGNNKEKEKIGERKTL